MNTTDNIWPQPFKKNWVMAARFVLISCIIMALLVYLLYLMYPLVTVNTDGMTKDQSSMIETFFFLAMNVAMGIFSVTMVMEHNMLTNKHPLPQRVVGILVMIITGTLFLALMAFPPKIFREN